MNKLLLLLLSICLLTACNNNPFGGNNNNRNRDDNANYNGNGRNNDPEKGWTNRDRNKFMDECTSSADKQLCSCVLEKLEARYASLDEADSKGGQDAGARLAQECMQGGGNNLNNNNNDDDDYNGNNNRNNNNRYNNDNNDDEGDNNNGGGSWTSAQRDQYVSECVEAARKNVSLTQARSYCQCMTQKIENKLSYQQAQRLTQADLQSPEWQRAIADCQSDF